MALVANVIEANNPVVLDYLLYPEQNPINQSYIYNQIASVSNTLNDIGKNFLAASQDIYTRINDSEMIRRAKATIKQALGITQVNEFSYYSTLQKLQEATPFMQNYIMANPVVRELYNEQRCDGYSDTYVDIDKGRIGDTHYHYRRVMDGVIHDVEENGKYNWVAKVYMEDLLPGDRELEIDEQSKVLATWEVMNMFIKAGQDVTNPNGGEL